jgi:hypothetical protein
VFYKFERFLHSERDEQFFFFRMIVIPGVIIKCYINVPGCDLGILFKAHYMRHCWNKDHFALMHRRCKLQLSKRSHKVQFALLFTPRLLFRSTGIGFASAVYSIQYTVSSLRIKRELAVATNTERLLTQGQFKQLFFLLYRSLVMSSEGLNYIFIHIPLLCRKLAS